MVIKLLLISCIFLIIPFFLDQFLMGKVETVMNKSEWFSFLGSYLGGGMAALITLFGVWWQLSTTKENEEKVRLEGFIKYITYILRENFKLIYPYNIFNIREKNYKIDNIDYFINFSDNFIENNIKLLFSIKHGEKILELENQITNYNNKFKEYNKNYKEIGERIDIIRISIDQENNLPEEEKIRLYKLLDVVDFIIMLIAIQREDVFFLYNNEKK